MTRFSIASALAALTLVMSNPSIGQGFCNNQPDGWTGKCRGCSTGGTAFWDNCQSVCGYCLPLVVKDGQSTVQSNAAAPGTDYVGVQVPGSGISVALDDEAIMAIANENPWVAMALVAIRKFGPSSILTGGESDYWGAPTAATVSSYIAANDLTGDVKSTFSAIPAGYHVKVTWQLTRNPNSQDTLALSAALVDDRSVSVYQPYSDVTVSMLESAPPSNASDALQKSASPSSEGTGITLSSVKWSTVQ